MAQSPSSSSPTPTMQAPAPFSDFDFSFDSALYPPPPPLPPSADLFSPSETTDLLGFLDNFSWEFDNELLHETPRPPSQSLKVLPPYTNPHLATSPEPSVAAKKPPKRASSLRKNRGGAPSSSSTGPRRASTSDAHAASLHRSDADPEGEEAGADSAIPQPPKPLLSTPQKRLNHIMSEQKRRNAIRDGYAQLIALLAPAGAPSDMGMPTRGRPKGSGARGKGTTKGKSGVLFRAVEYVRFLEDGTDALKEEVEKLERALSIQQLS